MYILPTNSKNQHYDTHGFQELFFYGLLNESYFGHMFCLYDFVIKNCGQERHVLF